MRSIYHTIAIVLIFTSCVQVPQESVQLSQVLGEDLKEMHRAHLALVNLHYNDLENNINSFVDNVYAPYQIGKLIEADIEDMKQGLDGTLSGALADAPDNPEAAKMALDNMEIFVTYVRNDIEDYRNELLRPIQNQRQVILEQLNNSYSKIMSANASITAHLASIRKVKEAQNELLKQIGIEEDVNTEIGQKIAALSGKVNEAIQQANKIDQQSDAASDKFNEFKETITNLAK